MDAIKSIELYFFVLYWAMVRACAEEGEGGFV